MGQRGLGVGRFSLGWLTAHLHLSSTSLQLVHVHNTH